MSKKNQFRFYDILPCYLDDERLAAFAIVELLHIENTPEEIYRQLLNCNYERWINHLEEIADNTRFDVLREWCEQKQATLDCLGGDLWGCGDNALIEKNGWKLIKGDDSQDES